MSAMRWRLLQSHLLFAVLMGVVLFAPKSRPGLAPDAALTVALCLIEGLFLLTVWRGRKATLTAPFDIILLVWALLLVWELMTSVLHRAHPVLIPAPGNVFDTFREHWAAILYNVGYSLQLLLTGFCIGLVLAVVLGLFAGWYPRLRAFAYPIANVMAPIPPTVFAPYLVVLMPTFRSASACIILLGVFWPQFLNMVLRVSSLDPKLMDNARALCVKGPAMVTKIILPYVTPGILQGLRVSLTTAFLMLTFAEMIGARAGIGFFITNANIYANYAAVIAGIIVCGVVVTVLSAITSWVQRRFMLWR